MQPTIKLNRDTICSKEPSLSRTNTQCNWTVSCFTLLVGPTLIDWVLQASLERILEKAMLCYLHRQLLSHRALPEQPDRF